jgi:hypothetical protein
MGAGITGGGTIGAGIGGAVGTSGTGGTGGALMVSFGIDFLLVDGTFLTQNGAPLRRYIVECSMPPNVRQAQIR